MSTPSSKKPPSQKSGSRQTPDLDELLEQAKQKDDQDFAHIPRIPSDTGDGEDRAPEIHERFTRLQADYQNLLRRMRTEQDDLGNFIRAKVIRSFLPIADNLDRALALLPQDLQHHEWVAGVLALSRNMTKTLTDWEVMPFESIGHEVDPDRHDVVSMGSGASGTIIAEIEKGYLIGSDILRHAKVVVGNGTPSQE